MRGAEGVSANPYRTALATTVRRDAPDPLRCPFRYHNVGASPAGRYGFLPGGTVPPGSRSTLPARQGTGRGLERGRRPDVGVDERVSYRVCRVDLGGYPPRSPTDPYVRDYRI